MNKKFLEYLNKTGEVGFIQRTIASLVYVEGLPTVRMGEMVMFENGVFGHVIAFTKDLVEVLSFSDIPLTVGLRVARTGEPLTIPVGEELLGTMITPLGDPLVQTSSPPTPTRRRAVDIDPLPIRARSKIKQPCDTGVTIVDLMVPLGRGQRMLVIGDQKTGKTYFLLRALLAQIQEGSIGIYVAVGKSKLVVQQVEDFLRHTKVLHKTIIMAAYAEEPASIIYLAPYAAMTLAEYFRDVGNDVILVIDDLSTHAKMYREISLLARRSPGRNSYPGDIFYIHSRLLERAGNFITQFGDRSITCLPVVEAALGDLTGYIQTNAISMTDGHIYFDYNLFVEGRRPAINPFLSVTRVGKQTQQPIKKEINQLLTSFLSSAERLQTVTSFGAELNQNVKDTLERQQQLFTLFGQLAYEVVMPSLQLFLFALVWNGVWKGKDIDMVSKGLHSVNEQYTGSAKIRGRIDDLVHSCSTLKDLLSKVQSSQLRT